MRRAIRWRIPIFVLLGIVLAAMVVTGVGGCYLSDLVKDGGLVPKHEDPSFDVEAVAIGEGRITLGITPDTDEDGPWMRQGVWGLEWSSGYDQVGAILKVSDEQVTREYVPLVGSPAVGDMGRLDKFAFPDDPEAAFDLAFEKVTFSSPLGEFPAWFIDGSRDTWAIFVHGRSAAREEALRMLPTVTELGFPSLVITYRNDEGVPADPSDFYRYGQTEWVDLEGAATYAFAHGAKGIILVGYSMGGAIVTNFLYESQLSDSVTGVILDAPMLDFGATVDLGASEKGYPMLFSALAKLFAGWRFDIDWDALDYLGRSDELAVPILLFHGDEDDTVPVETSDALAKARPDLVRYVRVANAVHVGSWNVDSAAYEEAVREFLSGLTR